MIDQQKLYDALDLIAKGITRPTQIAKGLGMTYRNYCNWMVRSNRGDPAFLIEIEGEGSIQFAAAIKLHTKLAGLELRGMLLQESVFGYDEVQVFQGNTVWTTDPVAAALSEQDREWLGYRKDALLEVNGALVPLVLKKKAPFAQSIRLLEAMFPDLRPTQTVNQNITGNVGVGVAFQPKTNYSAGPPAIPPLPEMPALPAPLDAEFNEVVDADLEEMLGPMPQPAPVNVIIAPTINMVAEPEPEYIQPSVPTRPDDAERVIRDVPSEREKIAAPTPKPVGYAEVPTRAPRSELERDLFARLQAARDKANQP